MSAEKLQDESIKQTLEAWNNWSEELGDRLAEKSKEWHSENSPFSDKEKVIKDYAEEWKNSFSTDS